MDIKKISIAGAVGFVVMGVVSVINGAITGAWFSGAKWFFSNMQWAGL